MNLLSTYSQLDYLEQWLHSLHFMLCAFAVMIGLIPAMVAKGSTEHKLAGRIYIPVSFAALGLGSVMAWREESFVLFCFNAFCAYLLLSGWRAVHEKEKPNLVDWLIPGTLSATALMIVARVVTHNEGRTSIYLMFFALNAAYLAVRDWKHLRRRLVVERNRIFFANVFFGAMHPVEWLNRHIAGMVGSLMANVSVIVLTLLPFSLHWLWPTALIIAGCYIAAKDRQKKLRIRNTIAPIIYGKFNDRRKQPREGRIGHGTDRRAA